MLQLVLAATLLMACTRECVPGSGCPQPGAAAQQERPEDGPADRANPLNPGVSKAEAFFAMYLVDPAADGSWQWLCRAAFNDHAPAQYALAVRYRDGTSSIAPNPLRAHAWFTRAMEKELAAAALAREELVKTMTPKQVEWAGKVLDTMTEADCDNPRP
jgi:hypothetical protein